MTQKDALNILKQGKNVFITGPAGSGKTFVVNQYIKYLKDHGVPMGITASTGIAATHMGGVTIHSWSGIGVRDKLSENEIMEIAEKSYIKKKVSDARVLIIDEVSMLHHFRLDMVDRVLRYIKKCEDPFGGLQVVLCGDFFQLPPVSRLGEPEARFIYNSDSWKEAGFMVCYLHENYRQNDDAILSILNEIRSGEVSNGAREELRRRYSTNIGEKSDGDIEPTRLYTHNIDVDAVNERELEKVDEYESVYEMVTRGKKPLVETLKKTCLAPENLRLKKGARIMCVKNNFDQGYVNGTLGVVVSCGWNVDPVIRTGATPDFPNGKMITIERATWAIEDDGKILAEIEQYPLRLAWAITVHKSQGMSLDAIEVDLSKAFEPGMGYVALSRVKTLKGLSVLGINENAFRVHGEVLEYDRHLRELSNKAESMLEYTDEKEIIQSQNEFLAKVAPLHAMGSVGRGSRMKKLKQPKYQKVSTYEKTTELIKKEMSLADMAKERGVVEETIIGQIEKILEGEKGTGDNLISLGDIQYLKKEIPPKHLAKLSVALEEVFDKQGDGAPPFLGPIKTKVGANISWKEIRLARVVLGYVKRKISVH